MGAGMSHVGGAGFAAALRALKERTPHSYASLAERTGISRSALHRYCTGKAVPADFAVVMHLARQARAQPDELRELHRLWAVATALRPEPPVQEPPAAAAGTAGTPEPAAETPEAPEPANAAGAGAAEPGTAAEPTAPTAPAASPERRGAVPRGPWPVVALVATMIALVLAVALVWNGRSDGTAELANDNRSLFSAECQQPIRLGQRDACVRKVQELLADTGVTIGIDGIFGPETLRRVEAFQVRAGLPVDGTVGDQTKRALYDANVSLTTWGTERVADRIRDVFTEDPDTAVRIARCQSFLDPLYILHNTEDSRNWGVFQISDARLRELRGTPEDALDPEWNIKAAHRLWAQNKDFSHWPSCLAALEDETNDH